MMCLRLLRLHHTDFTQSSTGSPYSNMAWDTWIECKINMSGWLCIYQNEKQRLVHFRNVNNVALIRVAHNALANQKDVKRKHMDCSPKWMQEDEQCVQDLVTCMPEFDSCFDPASPTAPKVNHTKTRCSVRTPPSMHASLCAKT